jgi:hypothetical protein
MERQLYIECRTDAECIWTTFVNKKIQKCLTKTAANMVLPKAGQKNKSSSAFWYHHWFGLDLIRCVNKMFISICNSIYL